MVAVRGFGGGQTRPTGPELGSFRRRGLSAGRRGGLGGLFSVAAGAEVRCLCSSWRSGSGRNWVRFVVGRLGRPGRNWVRFVVRGFSAARRARFGGLLSLAPGGEVRCVSSSWRSGSGPNWVRFVVGCLRRPGIGFFRKCNARSLFSITCVVSFDRSGQRRCRSIFMAGDERSRSWAVSFRRAGSRAAWASSRRIVWSCFRAR